MLGDVLKHSVELAALGAVVFMVLDGNSRADEDLLPRSACADCAPGRQGTTGMGAIRRVVVNAGGIGPGFPLAAQKPEIPLFVFSSPAAASSWQAVNDGVMGGVSDGRFRITERQTLEFYGTLSLENNGGFTSVRSRPADLGLQAGDSLVARVRGDGRTYQLNLYTSGRTRAFSYRAPVQTRRGEWTEVRIPLDRFEATSFGEVLRSAGPVDSAAVRSVGFLLAEKIPGPFSLEVEWIKVERQGVRLK